ncbi:Phosphopantothenate--cysteine ligase CAB2 [Cyberlindnera fabianii]|uniref:Phosphopantothenate--cysteine ligase CAB2 n=1 Tax=Cyberlindnera fabianii TaxID=36022 RepID=A0A1V2LFJ0_CYBFA|nr:Phosphopantothenate--cysteine ligase CAB2 [Cyberlindnera fabianii]
MTPYIHTSQPPASTAIDRSVPDFPVAVSDDENHYFSTNESPDYLDDLIQEARTFIEYHKEEDQRVVLVTSGGTTVPLENNTVRFIDNFSAGTRGATSAEYFLEQGYAVVFLHREFSLLPYSRHFSHTTNCFLDYMSENAETDELVIKPEYRDEMHQLWRKYSAAKKNNKLLLLPFTTVNQYLFSLRALAREMDAIGTNALFYLAAAVSDFFLPESRMPEHKIQAQDHIEGGKLVVNLDPVPKFLRRLVDSWAPGAMIVSFKLETDESILIKKAKQSLERYNHQLVIGNLLQTRKKEVVFVTKEKLNWYKLKDGEEKTVEIESIIVPAVCEEHKLWIESHRKN